MYPEISLFEVIAANWVEKVSRSPEYSVVDLLKRIASYVILPILPLRIDPHTCNVRSHGSC